MNPKFQVLKINTNT